MCVCVCCACVVQQQPWGPHKKKTKEDGISPRIIDGTDAPRGRFPYVGLLDRDPPQELLPQIIKDGGFDLEGGWGVAQCGVSLIAPDIVLSAAHCGDNYAKRVRIGMYNASDLSVLLEEDNNNNNNGVENLRIEREVWHPDFLGRAFLGADIMVGKLRTKSSFPIVRLHNTTILPNNNNNNNGSLPVLTLIGWGLRDREDWMSGLGVLQQAEGVQGDRLRCNRYFAGSTNDVIVQEDAVCVYYSSGRQCNGDSGSPLLMLGNRPEEDLQIGLVAYSFECARPPGPGVHTGVGPHFAWIAQQVCQLSDDPPAYFGCPPNNNNNNNNSTTTTLNLTTRQESLCPVLNLTLSIETDRYPEETGWRVYRSNASDSSSHELLGEVLPWHPNATTPKSELKGTILLDGLHTYTLSLTDALNDGLGGGPFDGQDDYYFNLGFVDAAGDFRPILVENGWGLWGEYAYYFVLHNPTSCVDPTDTFFVRVWNDLLGSNASVRLERLDTVSGVPEVVWSTSDFDLERGALRTPWLVSQWHASVIGVSNLDPRGLYQLITSELPQEAVDYNGLFALASLNLYDVDAGYLVHRYRFVPSYPAATPTDVPLNPFAPEPGEESFRLEIEEFGLLDEVDWILYVGTDSTETGHLVVGYGPLHGYYLRRQTRVKHQLRVPEGTTADTVFSLQLNKNQFSSVRFRIILSNQVVAVDRVVGIAESRANFTIGNFAPSVMPSDVASVAPSMLPSTPLPSHRPSWTPSGSSMPSTSLPTTATGVPSPPILPATAQPTTPTTTSGSQSTPTSTSCRTNFWLPTVAAGLLSTSLFVFL